MCGEDGFCGLQGRTRRSGGRSQTPGLEPSHSRSVPAPPQENGGEPRSNSVSESPSSPGPLAVSPDAGETRSEVGLGVLGGGGG